MKRFHLIEKSMLAIMKIFAAVCILLISCEGIASNTISWGARSLRDHHLTREIIHKNGQNNLVIHTEYLFEQKVRSARMEILTENSLFCL